MKSAIIYFKEEKMYTNNKTVNLGRLRILIDEMLTEGGYSQSGKWYYTNTLEKLERFMDERKTSGYSAQIGDDFLAYAERKYGFSKMHWTSVKTAIRRFTDIAEGRPYVHANHGNKKEVVPEYLALRDEFSAWQRINGISECTINGDRRRLTSFLNSLYEKGVMGLADLGVEDIYTALSQLSNDGHLSSTLRSFMRFAYDRKHLDIDYAAIIPRVRRKQALPTTYSRAEADMLLDSVDTTTPLGKRDYAILLTALRLGIRSSDIANLKLGDVDFCGGLISFVQIKTKVPHKLALLPELDVALKSYINNARPSSKYDNVFLAYKAPHMPLAPTGIYEIVSKRFINSGVDTDGRKRGAHSLCTTLASHLVEDYVPFDVVRRILGQESPESTKKYVLFQTEMLRMCAVRVPEPSGKFAKILSTMRGDSI